MRSCIDGDDSSDDEGGADGDGVDDRDGGDDSQCKDCTAFQTCAYSNGSKTVAPTALVSSRQSSAPTGESFDSPLVSVDSWYRRWYVGDVVSLCWMLWTMMMTVGVEWH